ncbi:MAG: SDR family oxidoreductase [Candidatus Omnitrophota bacterium]|nr:SDR family oxidoreductase [Candidatus Omnitrophota bacterium]
MPNERRIALITGATTGIGWELTRLFARDGYDLILVARHEDSLKRAACALENEFQISGMVVAADLSKPNAGREVFERVQAAGLSVHTLVNNAGYGGHGAFLESDLQVELDMMQLNMTALTELTKLFIPGMVEKGSGNILNVASTAAFQPGPFMAVYYASKAYVLSFSAAIREELKDKGINVTTLCPGPTESEFAKRAGMTNSILFKAGMMSAEKVARLGYEAMQKHRSIIVTGWKNKLLTFSVRLSPRWMTASVVRFLQEKV